MASASKTPNLNLPQWVGTEKPERTDFNAAFDAIDTTVASHLAESVSQGNPHGIDAKADKSLGTTFSATLENGWTGTLNYKKNGVGIVTVAGYIVPGTVANGTVVATLPEGFRPIIMSHPFIVINTVTQALEVGFSVSSSSGEVKLGKAFSNVAIAFHTTFQATEVA